MQKNGACSNVKAMTSAMAALTPPPLGQTILSASQQAALASAFAANWILPAASSSNINLAVWSPALLPGKKYFAELSGDMLMHLNSQAHVDASLHSLINAMAAFAPPAAGEVTPAATNPTDSSR